MRIFYKVSKVLLAVAFTLGLMGPVTALAATAPTLGAAATFSVLAGTNMGAAAAGITVTGDIGLSAGLLAQRTGIWLVGGNQYFSAPPATTAQTAAQLAITSMATQPSDGVFTLGPVFAPAPGVWTAAGNPTFSGTLTLTGSATDIWVFQLTTDFTFTGTVVLGGAAQACNVFWQIGTATVDGDATINIGPADVFVGTLIAGRDVSIVGGGTVNGRILAYRDFTADGGQTVSGPSCAAAVVGRRRAVVPPPLIDITKIPTPLALPLGPATTTYNYNVSNIGTVAMSNITVNDNKCATTTYISGDINNDLSLDLTEIWKYSCTTKLSTTTTNIVIATGNANGFTAFDTAVATVIVGVPVIPPLIHVVKVPSTFLLPAFGGPVTYTYTVTNPGTEPLSQVGITDDRCTGLPGRVLGHPGDLNQNNLLESNETWTFTCQTNIIDTTTNTATARGNANGLIAIDLAFATVAVAPPLLPKTGFPPFGESTVWNIITLASLLALVSISLFVTLRKHKV